MIRVSGHAVQRYMERVDQGVSEKVVRRQIVEDIEKGEECGEAILRKLYKYPKHIDKTHNMFIYSGERRCVFVVQQLRDDRFLVVTVLKKGKSKKR